MPDQIYGLDAAGMQRIVSAVKKVEKTSTSLIGDSVGKSAAYPGMWAKITGKHKPGNGNNPNTGYSWILQGIDKDSNVFQWTPAKTGNPFSAFEANGNDNVPDGTVVWLYTNGNGNWEFIYNSLTASVFCSQADYGSGLPDCAGATAPHFTDVCTSVQKIAYMQDDFLVYQQKHTPMGGQPTLCDPKSVLIEWNGMTWRHPVYGTGPDTACHAKIASLYDPGANFGGAPPALSTQIFPEDAVNYNQYPVYWTLTQPTDILNDCACATDQNKYPQARVVGNTYIDPCSFAPYVTDGSTPGKIGTLHIGAGLTLTWPSTPTGCGNTATISAPGSIPLTVRNTLSNVEVSHCCAVGILDLNTNYAQPSAYTDSFWVSSDNSILKVPVFTDLACNTLSDPCDTITKNRAVATQYTYFDPCWAYTTWYNCDSSVVWTANKVQFAHGFSVTTGGSGCNSLATIGLNLSATGSVSVAGGSGSVTVTPSTGTGCAENFDFAFTINPPAGPTGPCPTISATASATATTGPAAASVMVDDTNPCNPALAFTFQLPQGPPGVDGTDGTDGTNGADGAPGPCPAVSGSASLTVTSGATPAVNLTVTDSSSPCGADFAFAFTLPCPNITVAGTSSVTLTPGPSPAVAITVNTSSPYDQCDPQLNFAFTLPDQSAYTPGNPGNWSGSPTTVAAALDRIAAAVAGLLGGSIP